jgi:hypothetical protein
MRPEKTGWLVLGVTVMAVSGTVFRVATAPERVRDRVATAKRVCTERGGAWVKVEGRDQCQLPGNQVSLLP